MEVKIKNNNELIEADWTVEDGVMVVSPKEVKFEPKRFEYYYAPFCNGVIYEPCEYQWGNTDCGNSRYDKGWVFKTEEECQEFCKRLNQALENIKP